MPKPRIYLDTTIPSAYHTMATDPGAVERRAHTRRWWHLALQGSELLISRAVLKELSRGRAEEVLLRLAIVEDVKVLRSRAAIASTADTYIRHKLMPKDPEGDALHLALASHHRCDVLATWNYHHLANPNKLDRIRALNEELGLIVHAQTGEWLPDPLLDEVAEMRRKIMAEHGNDWRKVLKWHREQDRLFAQQNPNAKYAEKRGASAGVSGQ